MTDRRYSDEEVAAIFQKASETSQRAVPGAGGSEGLTLAELKEIGREVGIAPEAVALAARSIDAGSPARSTGFLGLPLSVERTVELERSMTDAEWERLVVQLREVFNARGKVSSTGSLRQWTNGNLQVLLEPVDGGDRLRLRTLNGAARTSIGSGLVMAGAAVAVAIAGAVGGQLGASMPGVALFAAMGAAMLANGALRLPGWARLRGRQMDAIAAGLVLPPDPPAHRPS
jgi:hypothetical protein